MSEGNREHRSAKWDEKYHALINYLNANPHIAATYPFMENVPRDLRDIIFDLSVEEARAESAETSLAALRLQMEGLREALVKIRDHADEYSDMGIAEIASSALSTLPATGLRERLTKELHTWTGGLRMTPTYQECLDEIDRILQAVAGETK
jgi:hypothetical protein